MKKLVEKGEMENQKMEEILVKDARIVSFLLVKKNIAAKTSSQKLAGGV